MIYTIESIPPLAHKLHATNQKIVLVTGFFDLLHTEHINFLQKAKMVGDTLLVAVESDARARALKGEGRPIESQQLRCQKLLALPCVDYVIALDENFNNPVAFESLISGIRPHILAVSSHTAHLDKKAALVTKYGGELRVVHHHNPQISTTLSLQYRV